MVASENAIPFFIFLPEKTARATSPNRKGSRILRIPLRANTHSKFPLRGGSYVLINNPHRYILAICPIVINITANIK
jgi:hypothetical protein